MALEMIIAGTDTSSVTMYYALLALRDDPSLEQRVHEELRTCPGARQAARRAGCVFNARSGQHVAAC